jgi:CheY-like chemotaxis protein
VKGRVLVADGDAERGRRVAAACGARGLVCRVTTHGAAALEAALADVPDVLVAQLALPLIEGPRLADILRANPRTQGVAVVFLGDREDDARRHGVIGQVVPPPIEPEVVASCVGTALATRGGSKAASSEGGVEGQLAQLPLADLLELFHVGRKTGCVEVVRPSGRGRRQMGRIELRDGDVVGAAVSGVSGEKALFRLLAWDRGSFAFSPEPPVGEPSIRRPTRALLREGMRQIGEWQRMAVELPPPSATATLVVPRSSLPSVIHPLTQEVLVVLDLYSRVQDVVDHCSHPDYQVLRTLHTMAQRGMVELRKAEAPLELGREPALFPPARVARLREWLEVDRPGAAPAQDGKLLVIGSEPAATGELLRLLETLPGVTLDRRVAGGAPPGADDLVVLGRIPVDGDVGVELLHVPASRRFAPIWPVAGHGALATLVVLSSPLHAAREVLSGALEALAGLPRARILHVLLLGKGEKPEPEEVARHLALADRGSLFLVPVETPAKAQVLLREMLARVLP